MVAKTTQYYCLFLIYHRVFLFTTETQRKQRFFLQGFVFLFVICYFLVYNRDTKKNETRSSLCSLCLLLCFIF